MRGACARSRRPSRPARRCRRPAPRAASSRSERIAWRARRSPTKRGRRRFAAPGMIPSLRAGSVQRQPCSARMWSTRQQQLAAAADRERLGRGDPQLLRLRLAQPAVDLVHEPEVADREEQVGDLAAVEVREVQARRRRCAARRSAGARRRRRAARAISTCGSSSSRSIAGLQRAGRRVVLGVEVARVAQLDGADVAARADRRGAEVDARRSRSNSSRWSSASCVGRSITSIRWRPASGLASTWPSSWPCAIS